MGTLFTLTLYAPDSTRARDAAEAAFLRVDKLEDTLSDYQADSELSLLRERPVGTPVPVSDDLFNVLSRAREVYRISGGVFDVTAGPYTRLWRFSRKRKTLPAPGELAEARASVGMDKLTLDRSARTVTMTVPGMRLDVGGIAKGYAADEALRVLEARGFKHALVAASGDIRAGDPPPGKSAWIVAVEGANGRSPGQTRIALRNAAVSTSGDTEQFIVIEGVRYSHILDPATGLGLTNRIQATIIAPNATMSDSLATSVCVMGASRGLKLVDSRKRTAALVIEDIGGRKKVSQSRQFGRFVANGE